MYNRRGPSLFGLIYIVIGLFIASDHNYFKNLNTVEEVISAVLAVLLWPLVLIDVNLHIN